MKKLTNNYSQLPLSALEPQFQAWSKVLTRHQSGNIFFLRNTGMLTRLTQYTDWYNSTHDLPIHVHDIDISMTSDPRGLAAALANIKSNVLLIVRDHFAHPDSNSLEMAIQQHYLSSPYSLLISHECAPHELHNQSNGQSVFLHNQFIYEAPSANKDLLQYINNICSLWGISLNNSQEENIIRYCGNQAWLTNEYIRTLIESPHFTHEEVITSPSLVFRTETLFQTLPTLYHNHFCKLPTPPNIAYEINKYNLMGTWLEDMVQKRNISLLNVSPTQVIYNQIDLSAYFSRGEKNVLSLAYIEPTIRSREEVAAAFYENDGLNYTDWALSQIISRLRTKLTKHGIPINITPKRGKGYGFTRK